MKKIFANIVAGLVLVTPYVALAQIPGVGRPIIPCGIGDSSPCQFCHFYVLVANITDFLLVIVIPLAAISVAYGGFLLMASDGSEGRRSSGKGAISGGIIGILIALVAWLLINSIMYVLVSPDRFPTPWNQFPGCT